MNGYKHKKRTVSASFNRNRIYNKAGLTIELLPTLVDFPDF